MVQTHVELALSKVKPASEAILEYQGDCKVFTLTSSPTLSLQFADMYSHFVGSRSVGREHESKSRNCSLWLIITAKYGNQYDPVHPDLMKRESDSVDSC